MTYQKALSFLESLVDYEKAHRYPENSLKLERISGFLELLGNPQLAFKSIHVAGSKGKGSTCIFIANILRSSGYKVGLYTSPHLCDFRERIRILMPKALPSAFEGMIPKKELAGLVASIKPKISEYNRTYSESLTFFEACTALAFAYFKDKKVDVAVLETGLGGRLDATNLVTPLVSVITPISYEHTQILGKTLAKIAWEKAGIIKRNTPVISAPQQAGALRAIKKKASFEKAPLFLVKSPFAGKIKLIGRHQFINAAVAQKALQASGLPLAASSVEKGLQSAVWPARCEVAGNRPCIVLDGAQNRASAKALCQAIKENFRYDKLILVLGISNDKDIKGICEELLRISDIIVLTKSANPRATLPVRLARYFKNKEIQLTDSVKQAKQAAYLKAKRNDLILVTGSLFVAGDFKKCLKKT